MVASSRTRPAGAFSGPLLLSAICAGFSPSSIGYQDLAGFFVRQPIVSEGQHEHLLASPFGTIHAATFTFSRPLGTAIAAPLEAQPVSFNPQSLDVKAWSVDEPTMARPALPIEYPTVNRRLKGDRMPLPQAAPSSSNPEAVPPAQPVNAPASHRPPRFQQSGRGQKMLMRTTKRRARCKRMPRRWQYIKKRATQRPRMTHSSPTARRTFRSRRKAVVMTPKRSLDLRPSSMKLPPSATNDFISA